MTKTTSKTSKKTTKSGSSKKKSKAKQITPVDSAATVAEPTAPVEAASETSSQVDTPPPSKPVRRRRAENITYVSLEKILAIVDGSGLKTEEKKAWLRINGPNGSRIYVPRRKHVGRVDIAGMEAPSGTCLKLGDRSFGSVTEQLDMGGPEERVLENFKAVLDHMASLPEEVSTKKRSRSPKGVEVEAVA